MSKIKNKKEKCWTLWQIVWDRPGKRGNVHLYRTGSDTHCCCGARIPPDIDVEAKYIRSAGWTEATSLAWHLRRNYCRKCWGLPSIPRKNKPSVRSKRRPKSILSADGIPFTSEIRL